MISLPQAPQKHHSLCCMPGTAVLLSRLEARVKKESTTLENICQKVAFSSLTCAEREGCAFHGHQASADEARLPGQTLWQITVKRMHSVSTLQLQQDPAIYAVTNLLQVL